MKKTAEKVKGFRKENQNQMKNHRLNEKRSVDEAIKLIKKLALTQESRYE